MRNDGMITPSSIDSAVIPMTTSTDPAGDAAVSTTIIDNYSGVIITLTLAGNAQTLQDPTDVTAGKYFVVVADDGNGANTIEVNGITMAAGEAQRFIWDGSAWGAVTAVDADDIAFTPAGDIVATDVQAAIEEVDAEKIAKDHVEIVVNTETLAAARTFLITDNPIQWLDPDGSDRDVVLPAEVSSTNLMFIILNTANGAGEDLVVKNDAAATIATLGPGMTGIFSCDGTDWKGENESGIFYDGINGYRGMGRVDPSHVLDMVCANGANGIRIQEPLNNVGSNAGLKFTLSSNSASSLGSGFKSYRMADNTSQLAFLNSNVEYMRICTGNVGIGTDTPAGILHSILSSTQPALFGGDTVEAILSASTTAAASTLTKAGENFLTTCAPGDLVVVVDSTTAADKGTYRIVTVDLDTQLTVDRAFAGSNTDVDFYVVKDVVLIGATDGTNGQRIMGYSRKPLQIGGDTLAATGHSLGSEDVLIGGQLEVNGNAYFDNDVTISTIQIGSHDDITATSEGIAASIATETTFVTTNGDSDLDDVSLADGTEGQIKYIACVVEGNAADTWKITPANMVGGTQITFAGIGEGCTLKMYSAGWVVVGNNGGTIS